MAAATTVMWIYIVLLFVGGLIGYLKAHSKASLITSAIFAGVLTLCNVDFLFQPGAARMLSTIVLVFLLLFFTWRFAEKKKFMPNGMMAVLTLIALVLRNIHWS
jgi:uncharacterized membrane protein (UPF0136 family)